MKNNYSICFYLALFICSIATARNAQSANPFDAAIKQIDTQSKELNQQIISSQQDGLAQQKIQRLELELTTLKTEHEQELQEMKKQNEQVINSLKKELLAAQQSYAISTSSAKTTAQELEQAKTHIEMQQKMIADLKIALAKQEEQYNTLKSHIVQLDEKNKTIEAQPEEPVI